MCTCINYLLSWAITEDRTFGIRCGLSVVVRTCLMLTKRLISDHCIGACTHPSKINAVWFHKHSLRVMLILYEKVWSIVFSVLYFEIYIFTGILRSCEICNMQRSVCNEAVLYNYFDRCCNDLIINLVSSRIQPWAKQIFH